jgi:alpha-glucosidase
MRVRHRWHGALASATVLVVGGFITVTAGTARAADPASWTVAGPAGSPVAAQLAISAAGTLSFGVTHGGATVLTPAAMGIETSAADLTTGLTYRSRADRTVTETYAMTTGKQLNRSATLTESTFVFTGATGTQLSVVVRVSAQGAAYRYVIAGSGSYVVRRETSAFSVPTGSAAWLLPYTNNYEGTRVQTTAGGAAAGDVGFPSLFEVGGRFALLTESDVDGRYAGARLTHNAGSGTYTVKLDTAPTASGTLSTPWRVAVVGDLATVTQSTLVDDLAPPSRVVDRSWIRPGAVAWSWMAEHDSPRDPVRMKQYVDFAARNGWRYVLIDEGWNASWVPDVTAYAQARGVGVILWFHWTSLDTDAERSTTLAQVKGWGVAGVKVDFMDSDSQARFQWYDAILAATSSRQLMVNFHGATIPRGVQRTWPHVMTLEAIRGAEQFQTRAATNTMFPFTRNVVGGMDYTPAAFLVADRDTTDAHEVATWLVFESGWQHNADRPEAYESRPLALLTMNQVPTVWDETRFLAGRPGLEAVFARRSGDRWFVGGISATAAKTFTSSLSFLGAGQYLIETLRDGPSGLVRETRVASRTDTLSVAEARNGGFVSIACPYTAGLLTCDRPARATPTGSPFVSDLPFLTSVNGYGPVERDTSNGEAAAGDGRTQSIRFTTYPKGLGMHADGEVSVWLGGACRSFTALLGIDDEVPQPGTVDFQVWGDGRLIASSGRVHSWDAVRSITANTTGVRVLTLKVTDNGDGKNYDHADWASARLAC